MPTQAKNRTVLQTLQEETAYDGGGHSRLVMGELANGTEFDEPDALIGLNTYLHVNGYAEEMDSAIIAGGLFPEKPEWYGTRNADRMRVIGQDEEKQLDEDRMNSLSRISYEIGEEDDAEWLREHHDEWIAKQMNTWKDIKSYAGRRMDDLFAGIELDRLDYCMGEEDSDFNRKEKEKKKLKKFIRKFKEYKADLEQEKTDLKEQIPEVRRRFEEDAKSYDVLMNVHNRLSSHLQATNPDVERFYDRILARETSEADDEGLLSGLSEKRKDEIRHLFDDIKDDKEAYLEVVDEYKEQWGEVKELEDMVARKDEIEDKLAKLDWEGEDHSVTRFTKQYAIEPEDAGALYMLVKRDLTNDVFEVIPDRYEDMLETHISRYATVEDVDYEAEWVEETDDGTLQEKSAEGTLESAEYEMFGDTMVIHNTKFRSNTATLHGMEEAVQEAIYRNMVEDIRLKENVNPSTIIVPHGAGGFATQRVNLTPEGRRMNAYRDDPEMVTVMTLPTFQSTDQLLDFKDRGLRHTHTKRIDKHLHDSGAIIQTVLDDGSDINEFVHHTSLSILGELTRKMWLADKDSAEFEETKDRIEDMCARPTWLRGQFADIHMGASNMGNTPSNYERAQRTANYLGEVYGEALDEIVTGENIEGVMDHTEMTKQVFASLPNVVRDNVADDGAELDFEQYDSDQEYILDVVEFALDDAFETATKNMEGTPYGSESAQKEAAQLLINDLIEKTDPELLSYITGNHPRNDSGGDEAKDMQHRLDMPQDQMRIADAGGTKQGGFGSWVDPHTERIITYHHRPPKGGKHLAKNIPRGIKQGNLEGDEFEFQHFHTPIAGVTMGKSWKVNPAQKGPDPYAMVNGYGAPVYGTIVQHSNHAAPDEPASDMIWYAFHHINDNTLEHDRFEGDRFDDMKQNLLDGVQDALQNLSEQNTQDMYEDVRDADDAAT